MKNIFNIPNLLTATRLILSGFMFYFILIGENITALILFIIAALTEIDGTVARKLKQETVFGDYFDAITDIFWIVGAFLAFVIIGKVPPWLIIITLFFLIAIGISVWIISRKTRKPIDISFHRPADIIAGISMFLYLLALFLEFDYINLVVIFAIIAITISSFNYWKKALTKK